MGSKANTQATSGHPPRPQGGDRLARHCLELELNFPVSTSTAKLSSCISATLRSSLQGIGRGQRNMLRADSHMMYSASF